MKKKKNTNWFLKTLAFLFLLFVSLYIALESGYYEAKAAKKTAMTEDAIAKFENDIKEGKPIDLESYTYETAKDYSNNTTDAAIFIGSKVEKFMSTGINDIFDLLKSLVT